MPDFISLCIVAYFFFHGIKKHRYDNNAPRNGDHPILGAKVSRMEN